MARTVDVVPQEELGGFTDDPRDSFFYPIELDEGPRMHFMWRHLRPAE